MGSSVSAPGSDGWGAERPAGMPHVPIRSPKAGEKIEGVIVGRTVRAIYVHFARGRTGKQRSRPCRGRSNGCEYCALQVARRWKGYLAMQDARGPFVMELTENAMASCKVLDNPPDGSLRGFVLVVKRSGSANNGRMTAWIDASRDRARDATLVKEFEPKEVMERLWAGEDRNEGQRTA